MGCSQDAAFATDETYSPGPWSPDSCRGFNAFSFANEFGTLSEPHYAPIHDSHSFLPRSRSDTQLTRCGGRGGSVIDDISSSSSCSSVLSLTSAMPVSRRHSIQSDDFEVFTSADLGSQSDCRGMKRVGSEVSIASYVSSCDCVEETSVFETISEVLSLAQQLLPSGPLSLRCISALTRRSAGGQPPSPSSPCTPHDQLLRKVARRSPARHSPPLSLLTDLAACTPKALNFDKVAGPPSPASKISFDASQSPLPPAHISAYPPAPQARPCAHPA